MTECPVGSEGCPCTGGGGCNRGLVCDGRTCVDDSGTSTNTSTGTSETETTGTVDLDDWTRRRPITVANELAVALNSFQVLLTVDYDDDMNVDFSDLRFTDENESPLPFWIESSVSPAYANVWVRVPTIPADGAATIYVYYGNPMAEPDDDGEATFSFFDGFDDDLDAKTWSQTGTASVATGRLTIETGSVYSNEDLVDPNQLVEIRTAWQNFGASHAGLRLGNSQTHIMGFRQQDVAIAGGGLDCEILDEMLGGSFVPGCLGSAEAGLDYVIGTVVTEQSNLFTRDRSTTYEHEEPWAESNFLSLGHVWGSGAGTQDCTDMLVDWVLVRAYAETEPTFLIGSEEEL